MISCYLKRELPSFRPILTDTFAIDAEDTAVYNRNAHLVSEEKNITHTDQSP